MNFFMGIPSFLVAGLRLIHLCAASLCVSSIPDFVVLVNLIFQHGSGCGETIRALDAYIQAERRLHSLQVVCYDGENEIGGFHEWA
ncbi:MAG: hypothetical protein IJE07_01770 [Clostridia bacterium]|nr:hypothetical protein [Clostridia bacterium]